MLSRHETAPALAAACALLLGVPASAQTGSDTVRGIVEAREIPVTVDNFVRAATDIEFGKHLALTGGVNRFFHSREPTRIDGQTTIRMNRDTLYSMAVIDVSEGATLTLPDAGGRYVSAMIVNQDHYVDAVFVGGGAHKLDLETFGKPYVVAIVRILADASSPEDIAAVNALQDRIGLEAESSKPFIRPNYDEDGFRDVLAAAKALAKHSPDSSRTFGAKGEVDPVRHFLGAAFGWGGLPETAAFYLNVEPHLPVGRYRIEVPAEVPVGAFWSISLYDAEGFFERNALDAYNVNSVAGTRNDDGSMTVHLGGCEDGRTNCLPIMEGWNYVVRHYQPAPEVLDGSWAFPSVERAD